MDAVLCYEVWTTDDARGSKLVQAYWDVQRAWKIAKAINEVQPERTAEVGVASGMQIDVTTNIRSYREDVI